MESLKPGGKLHRDAKPFLWKRATGIGYETLKAALARLGNSAAPAQAGVQKRLKNQLPLESRQDTFAEG